MCRRTLYLSVAWVTWVVAAIDERKGVKNDVYTKIVRADGTGRNMITVKRKIKLANSITSGKLLNIFAQGKGYFPSTTTARSPRII